MKQKKKSSSTNILLLQDVYNLGKKGDISKVKPGYARYLITHSAATFVTAGVMKLQEKLKHERAEQEKVFVKEALELSARIDALTLSKDVNVDTNGKMYGSVGINDVIELLKEKNVDVSKGDVVLNKPLKKVGVHRITVNLYGDTKAVFTLELNPVTDS